MKGSMRQRGSAWELRVYLGADPVTGKQRYATKTVHAGKREAQRLLNEMKVEAERGLATRTTATVGELLDRWLELAREDFSPKTTRETAGYIERNLRPALGDVRLSKLTTRRRSTGTTAHCSSTAAATGDRWHRARSGVSTGSSGGHWRRACGGAGSA